MAGARSGRLRALLLAAPVRPRWAAAPPQRLTDGAALLAVRCQARRADPVAGGRARAAAVSGPSRRRPVIAGYAPLASPLSAPPGLRLAPADGARLRGPGMPAGRSIVCLPGTGARRPGVLTVRWLGRQAPVVSEDAPQALLLDVIDLRAGPNAPAGPRPAPDEGGDEDDGDADGDADGGWVLVDGAGRGRGPAAGAGAARGGAAPALRLLPDPAAAERLFCVAGGAAWALTLPWLPALAALLADGVHMSWHTLPDTGVSQCEEGTA